MTSIGPCCGCHLRGSCLFFHRPVWRSCSRCSHLCGALPARWCWPGGVVGRRLPRWFATVVRSAPGQIRLPGAVTACTEAARRWPERSCVMDTRPPLQREPPRRARQAFRVPYPRHRRSAPRASTGLLRAFGGLSLRPLRAGGCACSSLAQQVRLLLFLQHHFRRVERQVLQVHRRLGC